MMLKVIVLCAVFAAVSMKDEPKKKTPAKKVPLPKIVCPKTWDKGTFKCYKVVPRPEKWIDALMFCIVMRAHLLEIDSEEEQKEVVTLLKKNHPKTITSMRPWIDGSDLSSEGEWEWMNFGQNLTYTNWYGKKQPPLGHNLHCAMLLGDHGFLWGASDCNYKRPFICESNPIDVIPVDKS